MLHELSHNVFGPHDAKFHALWDQLREEYEGLIRKGYTGEGFLSEGRKLGGRSVPRDEARRIARAAAEKRRTLTAGSGEKLGGAPLRPGQDIRKVIVDAIERRNRVTKGCGSTNHNEVEIIELGHQATTKGFRTKADEDKANEEAIAQALWELVQEDEKAKYGSDYVQPSQSNPSGSMEHSDPSTDSQTSAPPPQKRSKPTPEPSRSPHQSRLLQHGAPKVPLASKPNLPSNNSFKLSNSQALNSNSRPEPTAASKPLYDLKPTAEKWKGIPKWICPICTCHNPETFLCCDACTTERPTAEAREYVFENEERPQPPSKALAKPAPKMWTCHVCGNKMEEQWWTCSACETMKLKS